MENYDNLLKKDIFSLKAYLKDLKSGEFTEFDPDGNKALSFDGLDVEFPLRNAFIDDKSIGDIYAETSGDKSVNIVVDLNEPCSINSIEIKFTDNRELDPETVSFFFSQNRNDILKDHDNLGSFKVSNGEIKAEFEPEKARFLRMEFIKKPSAESFITAFENISVFGVSLEEGNGTLEIVAEPDNIIQPDFDGIGDNYWVGPNAKGMNSAFETVNFKRINTIKPAFVRMMFMPSWLIFMDEPESVQKEKWEKGIYNFESRECRHYLENCLAFSDSGTSVQVNMGGRVDPKISKWFSIKGSMLTENGTRSAPRDLESFANATVALFKYLREKGCKTIDYLSFYNEINGGCFEAFADKRVYYSEMIKKCHYAFLKENMRDSIKIFGTDLSGYVEDKIICDITDYIIENCRDEKGKPCYDFLSDHEYPLYKDYNEVLEQTKELTKRYPGVYITEYGSGNPPGTDSNEDRYNAFSHTEADQAIAHSNAGCGGSASWFLCGTIIGPPLNVTQNTLGICMWLTPCNKIDQISPKYMEFGLMMRYVPRHCSVLKTSVNSKNIITAVYKKGEDMTIAADINDGGEERKIKIFVGEEQNGKVFEKHKYIYAYDRFTTAGEENAILPVTEKYLTVSGGYIYDDVDSAHNIVLYTTLKEQVQIILENVLTEIKCGESKKIKIKGIYGTDKEFAQNNENDVTFEMLVGNGSVDKNGNYSSKGTKKGETVSVKIISKYDPSSYAVAIFSIV